MYSLKQHYLTKFLSFKNFYRQSLFHLRLRFYFRIEFDFFPSKKKKNQCRKYKLLKIIKQPIIQSFFQSYFVSKKRSQYLLKFIICKKQRSLPQVPYKIKNIPRFFASDPLLHLSLAPLYIHLSPDSSIPHQQGKWNRRVLHSSGCRGTLSLSVLIIINKFQRQT